MLDLFNMYQHISEQAWNRFEAGGEGGCKTYDMVKFY